MLIFVYLLAVLSCTLALYNEEPCTSSGGNCLYTSKCPSTSQVSGQCPTQASNIKCCIPYQESACTKQAGKCQVNTKPCPGSYVSGLCPTQPNDVTCCTASLQTGPSQALLDCLCYVESRCEPLGCADDVGTLSCGYYQIKWPYYQDCNEPGGSSQANWKTCSEQKTCATECVTSYLNRYGSYCANHFGLSLTDEVFARIHNGGPYGCGRSGTVGYWETVKACLG